MTTLRPIQAPSKKDPFSVPSAPHATLWILIGFLVNLSGLAAAQTRIGLVQYDGDAHFGDYEHNRRELTKLANQAVELGAAAVQLPEGALYGYASADEAWCAKGRESCVGFTCRDVTSIAEMIPNGPSTEYWLAWAQNKQALALFNLPERDGAQFYNTTVIVGPRGYINKYRKRALYRTDQCFAASGKDATTIEISGRKFGIATCMDANFSHYFTSYREQGAASILISMDWDQSPEDPSRSAGKFFKSLARSTKTNIYASDNSKWDGTGLYFGNGANRSRPGMSLEAIKIDGVTVVTVAGP
ncbi:MAG: carbon-nitrogen hydrolase family protein [Proteobacteria bacterium]|nr:carbon-nitrogen hydrolase family protein [Pseudomonadota bacterium]